MSYRQKDIGRARRRARQRSGLTVSGVGRTVGVGESMISMWETGRRGMRAEQLAKYCSAVGVTAGEILTDCARPQPGRALTPADVVTVMVDGADRQAALIAVSVEPGESLFAAEPMRALGPADVVLEIIAGGERTRALQAISR